ncbi:hypothetical protein MUDAN_MDHGFNIF_01886 [Lactiplantibacillus mudanjiangensis]|uniref:Uncharacterized protein n=1 Tax=Lactiplantibacillus mudanjiangensis TaxID=1296538 RepID=A0A660EBI0_9LACO|nr:hypothetical protein MUDAN_IGPPGNFN_02373 [Lactiplantibacillus mudanjiangensis]VDG30335.1 hypothetical protein MUDAN_MDHGFNIF_01886 [Lactiplantibacillus mudanjiangensis]
MAPTVKTSLVWVVFPDLRCGRLLRLAVLARLKSEVEARFLAGTGPHSRQRITGWRRWLSTT